MSLDHIEPSAIYSQSELEDFYKVTEVLTSDHQQHCMNVMNILHVNPHPKPRRRWSSNERHEILLAVHMTGSTNPSRLVGLVGDRSERQVRTTVQ